MALIMRIEPVLRMRAVLHPTLELKLVQTCPVCDQHLSSDKAREDCTGVLLLGAVDAYQICPQCHQEPPAGTKQDPEYQRKVRVAIYQRYGVVVKLPSYLPPKTIPELL